MTKASILQLAHNVRMHDEQNADMLREKLIIKVNRCAGERSVMYTDKDSCLKKRNPRVDFLEFTKRIVSPWVIPPNYTSIA